MPDVLFSPFPQPIAVAVSGGADSLSVLLRLKEAGHAVLALHGLFFSHANQGREAEAGAMRARLDDMCRSLGVPLHVVDLRADFERLVMRPFVQSYAGGLTPNPCALCNAGIKFGLLRQAALNLGAVRLATGHYAGLAPGEAPDTVPALYQGADAARDQSYFLCLVPAAALAGALFPLADMSKKNILAGLEEKGLATPQPGESREICFIDAASYQDVLPSMADARGIALPGPGPMLLADGRRVGTHKGLWRYTEGQRRGLGLGWAEPLHVIAKEADKNVLRLGPRREMKATGCLCGSVNVLVPYDEWPPVVLVKTRYRESPKEAEALLVEHEGALRLRIRFARPDSALAPGQIAALHAPLSQSSMKTLQALGEPGPERLRLLAGAIIESVE